MTAPAIDRTQIQKLWAYLTPAEQAEAESHIRILAGSGGTSMTFKEYIRSVDARYRWYRHCEVLGESLQAVADGELDRLMVFMPPRHGKSHTASRHFPAYYLLKHPEQWVGLCSYEATLAQDFSRTARDGYTRAGGTMRGDSQAVALWQTQSGGGMWAAGVGGPITGKGAHLGLIDDPIKNDEEAASEVIRAKQISWYASTFYTRIEPKGAIAITQTRWHQGDLSGSILAQEEVEPERWHIVNFDALHEPDAGRVFPVSCTVEPDWRAPGAALCPERYDEEALTKIKGKVGSYFWGALYQQHPTPLEGGHFKRAWWQQYSRDTMPSEFDFICASWDMAFKGTDHSDFVVGQVWGVKHLAIYLLDQIRGRMDFPETVKAVQQLHAKWPSAHVTLIEDAANGAAVIASLRRSLPGVVAIRPQGGKESRAAGVSPLVEAGHVYLPEPKDAPWVGDFIEECAAFPAGANDDQVDAMTQALNRVASMRRAEMQPLPTIDKDRHPGWQWGKNGSLERKTIPHAADPLDRPMGGRGVPRARTPNLRMPR